MNASIALSRSSGVASGAASLRWVIHASKSWLRKSSHSCLTIADLTIASCVIEAERFLVMGVVTWALPNSAQSFSIDAAPYDVPRSFHSLTF